MSLALFGTFLTIAGGWLIWIDRDPDIAIPTPAMPAINGFTYLRDAGSAVIDGEKIGHAVENTTRKPSAAGRAALLAPVPASTRGTGVASTPAGPVGAPLERDHIYTPEEKAALVAENQPALAKLREGLKYPYMPPPARSFSALFPYYSGYRGLARLLVLEAQVKGARGDWNGAMQSSLDAIELGRRFPHGSTLIGKLTGIACEAIGRKSAWDIVGHLSGAQARGAALRLGKLSQDHVTMADTLTEEKWMGMAGLMEIMRQRRWRWPGVMGLPNDSSGAVDAVVRNAEFCVVLLPYSKRAILTNYQQLIDAQIDSMRRPYAAQKGFQPSEPSDPINRIIAPVFSQAGLKDTDDETQNALLETALALRAYRCDHGKLPPNLAALTPGYLPSVPRDLFAPAATPLQYRVQGDPAAGRYLLYSVGPDGVDNGGTPIVNTQATSESQKQAVEAESTGDIVAGVNRG